MLRNLLRAGVVRTLFLKVVLGWIGEEARAVTEGKRGAFLQRAYVASRGRKMWIGGVLGAVAAVMAYLQLPDAAEIVGTLGGLLFSIGLVDKKWRDSPIGQDSRVWRFLRNNSPDIIAAATAVSAALTTCDGVTATVMGYLHMSCSTGLVVVGCLLAAQMWVLGEAALAKPPVEPTVR